MSQQTQLHRPQRSAADERLREMLKADYIAAERSFAHFFKAAWSVLEPKTPLLWNWHHDLICEYLEACAAGQIRNLIINIAPRSTKSLLVTVAYPCWRWLKTPSHRTLFGSWSADLAATHSILRRTLIESWWYQTGYHNKFQFREDVNTKANFANTARGHMKAGAILSPPMGEGGDEIILDDPHNTKQVESDAEREKCLFQYDHGWSSRLNNKKTGNIILVMQRLHEADLTGHLLEKDLGFTHLKIPTIAEERTRVVFPISKRVVTREAGSLLHPSRDGERELAIARKTMGPYGFSGQHQQDPVPATGGMFEVAMFEYAEVPEKFDYKVITADTAYTEKEESDFTVFSAWGVKGSGHSAQMYLVDCWREQIKSTDVEAKAITFIKRHSGYGFRGAYIEPKGHGIYLNQSLPKKSVLVPSETARKKFFEDRKLDKVERANNAVPHLTGRKIIVSDKIAGREDLVSEALKFPKGRHDDFVDTLIDAVKYVYGSKPTMFDVQ